MEVTSSKMYGSKSLLRDNSWIKRPDDEEENVDRDPNYGRTLLSRRDSDMSSGLNYNKSSSSGNNDETIIRNVSTSVKALSKRFSGGPDGVGNSTSTTTVSRDGKTMTTTETTTVKSVRSALKSSKTNTFTERVLSSSKGDQYSSYSPTKTTEVRINSPKDAEEHLYETLDPSPYQSSYSPSDSKSSVISTETVTIKNGSDIDAENQLYDRLIPKSIQDEAASGRRPLSSTETVTVRSSTIGGDYEPPPYRGENSTVTSSTSIRSYSSYTHDSPISSSTSYSVSTSPGDSYSRPNSSYEYSSSSSPSSYSTTTYKTTSRSDNSLSDPLYSTSSIKNVYSSSERTMLEKDLCTTCHKPFTGDAKMVLDDMNINCHATCFRCNVCNNTLGSLKAGDSMWVYRGKVHCENCFESTKAKWHR